MRTLSRAVAALALVAALAAAPLVRTAAAQRVFTGDGTPTTLDALVAAGDRVEIVFLGEQHDDSVAHVVQADVLRRLHAARTANRLAGTGPRGPLALSMEMFETDVQPVLDEYLAGLINERSFLAASRPWVNYARDYRPMVEFAREHALPVVAANAPRRYVNRVSRLGVASLDSLGADARALVAPAPIPAASPDYRVKWNALMGDGAQHMGEAGERMLMAQTLWDATMADRIARTLRREDGMLVVHPVGRFHVERRTGTPEALAAARPGTRMLVVVLTPESAWDAAVHAGLGDFVVLTR